MMPLQLSRRSLIKGAAALFVPAAPYIIRPAAAQTFPRRKRDVLLHVNRDDPLARNILDCVIFGPSGQNGFVNLGSPKARAPSFNTAIGANSIAPGVWNGAPEPNIYKNQGATTSTWCTIPNWVNYAVTDISVFCRFIPHSWPNANTALWIKDSGGVEELDAFLDTSGNLTFIYVGGSNVNFAAATGFTLNRPNTLAITRQLSNTTCTVYANGAQIGSNATFSSANGDTGPLEIGSRSGNSGQTPDYGYVCWYTAARIWSAAEILRLHLDPYCFLTPVFDPVGDVVTAAAVAASCGTTRTLLGVGC